MSISKKFNELFKKKNYGQVILSGSISQAKARFLCEAISKITNIDTDVPFYERDPNIEDARMSYSLAENKASVKATMSYGNATHMDRVKGREWSPISYSYKTNQDLSDKEMKRAIAQSKRISKLIDKTLGEKVGMNFISSRTITNNLTTTIDPTI